MPSFVNQGFKPEAAAAQPWRFVLVQLARSVMWQSAAAVAQQRVPHVRATTSKRLSYEGDLVSCLSRELLSL
jgi:hypothetical protein